MTALRELVYVRPGFGGIFDYSETLLGILQRHYGQNRVTVITVPPADQPWYAGKRLAKKIQEHPGLLFFELGAGDAALFWAIRALVSSRNVAVTVHDPGVMVNRLLPLGGLARARWPLPVADWFFAKAERSLLGNRLIRATLARASVRIVLNESITDVAGLPVVHLPQLVYRSALVPYQPPTTPRIAFCGFWDRSKGLEELLATYAALLPRYPGAEFVVAGGGAVPGDPYDRSLRARARAVSQRIQLPGFVPPERFGDFLDGLSALVLPYHPEVPGAASAMLMRAQERGVPLVVSDTPKLRSQVDPANVTLVPPRDAPALCRAIAAHLDDPGLFATRARTEQERIYREHSHAAVATKLAAILHPLMEAR